MIQSDLKHKVSVEPKFLHLFHFPKDRLRLTVGDECSYVTVKPSWASPLTRPGRYLALLDGKGQEIIMVTDPTELSESSAKSVREELRRRYLTSTIVSIESVRSEFGATYWHVVTDRGTRDFVTQSLQENVVWLEPNHILLIDVDGNRFEIPNTRELSERSRKLLENEV